MKLYLAAFLFLSAPAFADVQDGYDTGYNAGYYGASDPAPSSGSYGRGYDDGAYDANQEDTKVRQDSEEFEAALVAEEQRDIQR